ncbi:MAG: autotransporter-associated beta strand repeat-containing protein [bacterium]
MRIRIESNTPCSLIFTRCTSVCAVAKQVFAPSLFVAVALCFGSVQAASYTNTASGNWSPGSATIWSNGVAGVSAADTIIVFNPKATDNSTNNAGAFSLNQLLVVTNQTVNLYSTGGSSLNFVNNGGTLPAITNAGTSTLTINSPITLGANLTLGAASTGAITINSNITESVTSALTKTGTNTLTLAGSNTFSGGLTIKAGTVLISQYSAGTGTITLGDSSGANTAKLYFNYQSNGTYTNNIVVAAGNTGAMIFTSDNLKGNATINGTVALNNNLTFDYGSSGKYIAFNGLITETSSGSPALAIASVPGMTGTDIKIMGGVVIGTGGLTFSNNNANYTWTVGPGNISGSGPLTFNANSNSAFTVSATNINHSGSITNSGTGMGATTISGNIGSSVTNVVQNNATSQMILTGMNTYNGPTTINAGTLFVNGTNTVANGTGTYTVKSGGTLGGKGKIELSAVNGSVVVEAGGKVSPGSVAGTVGTLTLALSTSGVLDISAAAGTAGTLVFDLATTNASDLITLPSGTLNIGSGALSLASLQISGILDASQTTYTLVHTVNGITGTMMGGGTSVSGTLPGSSVGAILSISGDGKDLVLNLTSFPPPKAVTWRGNIFSQWESVTTNWVVTGTSTPTNFMYSDTVTFDDSGIATATITSIAPVTPASMIVSNSVNAYTLSASIAGSGALTKKGTGTLNLQNASANTFSGGLNIQMGTVAGQTAQQNFGTGTISLGNGDTNSATLTMSQVGRTFTNSITTVVGSTGTLLIKCNGGGQTFTFNGPITLNSDLSLGASDNTTDAMIFSGGVTGTGNLILKNDVGTGALTLQTGGINMTGAITNKGSGTNIVTISGTIGPNVTAVVQNSTSSKLILSGTNNTYAGITTVSLGTLETQKTNSLGAASSVIIATDNGNAKMYLNFTGTNTIKFLKINGVNMDRGVYGTNAPLNNLYFSGTGALNVLKGPPNGTIIRFN